MTKKEFDSIFENAYKDAIHTYANPEKLKEKLNKYKSGNEKVSTDELILFAFLESVSVNRAALKPIFESVLEFAD